MKFKKLLFVISIIIVSMFALMLTTSYAWYSFEKGSTKFETVTKSEDILVSYQDGEYINTDIAVPVVKEQIDKYASKNNFNIKVTGKGEVMIAASLIDVTIDSALNKESFVIDLFYQGDKIDSIDGSKIVSGNDIVFENVLLKNKASNQFEIRLYILDDGSNQNDMMKKTFSAKVKVDVISRLNSLMVDYENPDINIDKIVVDGIESDKLPVEGFYKMSASCEKGSKLFWEPLTRVVTYSKGSYVNDTCSLTFVTSDDYPLLSDMDIGSYVKYSGINGCEGNSCIGENANYVNDNVMGYCNNKNNQFSTSGWRIGYIENDSAYLISAGAVECMCVGSDGKVSNRNCVNSLSANMEIFSDSINKIALKYCNKNYVKNGICDNTNVWAMNDKDFEKLISNTINSCYGVTSNKDCGYNRDLIDNGSYYWINSNYDDVSLFSWDASYRKISNYKSNNVNGVRPVINLESSIVVIGGTGTYNDPYIIK